MKLLVQNVETKLFYGSGNVWTTDPAQAFDFKLAQALFDFVDQRNLHNVQLAVYFEDRQTLEAVPLETSFITRASLPKNGA